MSARERVKKKKKKKLPLHLLSLQSLSATVPDMAPHGTAAILLAAVSLGALARRRGATGAPPCVLEAPPPRKAPPSPAASEPEKEEPPLSLLPVEMWAKVCDALGDDGCRDAVMFACAFAAAARAYSHSKWPRTVRVKRSGAVLEPFSGAFDVTVAPGEDVQAAVDACPRGGSVLLLPGEHEGPLVLEADQEVHVFGRGQATLQVEEGTVLTSSSVKATIDGLIVRQEAADEDDVLGGIKILGGGLRLQASDISCEFDTGILISGGAGTDPVISGCRYVKGLGVSGSRLLKLGPSYRAFRSGGVPLGSRQHRGLGKLLALAKSKTQIATRPYTTGYWFSD